MTRIGLARGFAVGICTAALAACGSTADNGGGNPSASASDNSTAAVTIHVVADPATVGTYNPKSATAKVGDTVKWVFDDDANSHTVTSDSGAPDSFDSGTLAKGQSFPFTFSKAGTYKYHCNLHAQMVGTVTVS